MIVKGGPGVKLTMYVSGGSSFSGNRLLIMPDHLRSWSWLNLASSACIPLLLIINHELLLSNTIIKMMFQTRYGSGHETAAQLIAKPGNKTAAVPWPDPFYIHHELMSNSHNIIASCLGVCFVHTPVLTGAWKPWRSGYVVWSHHESPGWHKPDYTHTLAAGEGGWGEALVWQIYYSLAINTGMIENRRLQLLFLMSVEKENK